MKLPTAAQENNVAHARILGIALNAGNHQPIAGVWIGPQGWTHEIQKDNLPAALVTGSSRKLWQLGAARPSGLASAQRTCSSSLAQTTQ